MQQNILDIMKPFDLINWKHCLNNNKSHFSLVVSEHIKNGLRNLNFLISISSFNQIENNLWIWFRKKKSCITWIVLYWKQVWTNSRLMSIKRLLKLPDLKFIGFFLITRQFFLAKGKYVAAQQKRLTTLQMSLRDLPGTLVVHGCHDQK